MGSSSGRLWVTGDADDMVQLDVSAWNSSGHAFHERGHSYAVFNANQGDRQLLLDQQLLCQVI